MSFVHLHTHTQYSLLDGTNKIENYVARVKELGMNAAAITDHGNMYGVIAFYKAAQKAGIRPIIGCEIYVAPASRFEREAAHGENRYYHLVLLAENNTGYQNLIKIVSIGYTEGFYYRPRVDFETLLRYHEGLICLSACLAGEVARNLVHGFYEEAKETALRYEAAFGKDHYFLELQDHGLSDQRLVNESLIRLHEETGIPLVCTNDVHYTNADDADAHDVLLCIQTGRRVSDENRMHYEGGQYYVKSEQQMRDLFPYAAEAVDNTQAIADRCCVTLLFGHYKIPKYEVPAGYKSAYDFLTSLCEEGFDRKYRRNPQYDEAKQKEIHADLLYELRVIREMGFVEYILIVWDYINWSRTHDCRVGPGRGSAAGSKVCYCTGITDVDPVKYNLLFERFLNPERVSMPDIDLDFEDAQRGRVIDYVQEKYGRDCVTQITTFGTMLGRGVIKAVGRALDFPYAETDRLAKMVPAEANSIERALVMNPEFRAVCEGDASVREMIDMAKKLEGLPNHTGVHAAGVVIYPGPASDYVPLGRANDGTPTAEYNKDELEELGLLKMDFLGLRTLTVIKDTVKNVKDAQGIEPDIDHIDLNDADTLSFISTGKTAGVFQLESAGMQNFMRQLQPKSFEDVMAGISLYRPGPMDFIPEYIRCKNHPQEVTYQTPELKSILSSTYGCIVYQEQVMQIVQKLAGYSMAGADNIRRAMSKKKQYIIEEERKSFIYGDESRHIKGCIKNGISEDTAGSIYDSMVDFAKYAFNKSHAAAYAVLSMQTAWLKNYYPVEFMAALLTSVIDDAPKAQGYLYECREMGISVLPPDVNCGYGEFTVEDGKIRYGMYAIKALGRPSVDRIVEGRRQGGWYRSLQDFIERTLEGELNRRAVENLIKAGACDHLGGTRRQMLLAYPALIDRCAQERKSGMSGQMSLFDLAPEEEKSGFGITYPDVGEWDSEEKLSMEKEVLGIYLSGHPLQQYRELIEKTVSARAVDFLLDPEEGTIAVTDGCSVIVGGMISEVSVRFTKKNQQMAYLTLEDLTGTVEVIVFPQAYSRYRSFLSADEKIFVVGRVSADDDQNGRLICERIVPFADTHKELWLQFPTMADYRKKQAHLTKLLSQSRGADEVVLYIASSRSMRRCGDACLVSADEALLTALRAFLGEENVRTVSKPIRAE